MVRKTVKTINQGSHASILIVSTILIRVIDFQLNKFFVGMLMLVVVGLLVQEDLLCQSGSLGSDVPGLSPLLVVAIHIRNYFFVSEKSFNNIYPIDILNI
jgi:hypothetical protein